MGEVRVPDSSRRPFLEISAGLTGRVLVNGDSEDFANFVEYERLYGANERPAMKSFAPILKYEGGHGELERLLRLAPVVDIRDSIQRARGRIAARAEKSNPTMNRGSADAS
jgi:hypothetical protein